MTDTYVITEACIDVKDATCVDVCPAACIHTTPDASQYYIDPVVCIACEQCELVCPVNAIFLDDDVPEHLKHYIEINAGFFREYKTAAPPLSREQADAMIGAARRYAEESDFALAIAVVGSSGELIAAFEMHGIGPAAAMLALDKAYTAANLEVATHQLGGAASTRALKAAPEAFQHERLVEQAGGYPAMNGDQVIGAIGVAGTPGVQTDLQCCLAALAELKTSSH